MNFKHPRTILSLVVVIMFFGWAIYDDSVYRKQTRIFRNYCEQHGGVIMFFKGKKLCAKSDFTTLSVPMKELEALDK